MFDGLKVGDTYIDDRGKYVVVEINLRGGELQRPLHQVDVVAEGLVLDRRGDTSRHGPR